MRTPARASGGCATRTRWPGWQRRRAGPTRDQVLVLSTGVIGHFLPMDKIARGVTAAAVAAGVRRGRVSRCRPRHHDDRPLSQGGQSSADPCGQEIRITGMAKGAAMIGPNMATMLAVVMTDARLAPEAAQRAVAAAVDDSFNCISVDGHMSTNDTVLLMANGAARRTGTGGKDLEPFQAALDEVCIELARMIPDDGEGATHLITIDVQGCASRDHAFRIAKTVANSPLVKTAVRGRRSQLGPHRLGRRLCRRPLRSAQSEARL